MFIINRERHHCDISVLSVDSLCAVLTHFLSCERTILYPASTTQGSIVFNTLDIPLFILRTGLSTGVAAL